MSDNEEELQLICSALCCSTNRVKGSIEGKCSLCSRPVAIAPNGQRAIRGFKKHSLICSHCVTPEQIEAAIPNVTLEDVQIALQSIHAN